MSAEDRALQAIQVTRLRLEEALRSPEVLVKMAAWDVEPDAVEDVVSEILEYLEKTGPEKPQEAEA